MAVLKYLNANGQWEAVDTVGAVKYIEQNLSDEQKAQARENIGLDGDFLTKDNLQEVANTVLAQAKASGDFDGADGQNGQNGADGKTPYIKNGNWWIDNTDTGVKAQGVDGAPGATPVKGTDYFTPDEITAIAQDVIDETKFSGDFVSLMGTDPITSLSEDTPVHWAKDLSAGYYFITANGVIADKPSQYGYIVNYRCGNTEVFQFWLSMMYGDVYTRSGNSTGWGTTWKQVGASTGSGSTDTDAIVQEVLAALPTWTGGSY